MGSMYKKMSSHGSISIPVAMRRELGLEPRDPMELKVNSTGEIVIRPYLPRCIFCGTQNDIHKVAGRNVCTACAKMVYESLMEGERENG